MAYQVDRFNGTFLTSVEDGTIDTTTDLRFVGKNYAGYGEVQNENFLHLLENFNNTSAPPKVITGQIWYDSANKKLKYYDGSRFKIAGGAEVSTTAPSGLVTGEFWWDSSAKQLYAYDGADYVLVGPEASPDLGASGIQTQVVKDTLGNNHTIVKLLSGSKVIGIISSDEFTLDSSINPILDFSLIKKGYTLIKTNTNGISSDDHYYWGTASDSLRLAGIPAAQYLRSDDLVFESEVRFLDPGYTVGDDNDLRVRVENSNEVIVEQLKGAPITFRITVTETTDERDIAVISSTSVHPGRNLTYDLGTVGNKWNNVFAGTYTGNLTGNVTGNLTGNVTGNVLATDTQVLVNATSKEIGYAGATLRGTLFGNVQGNVTGTADNAVLLNSISSSISIPSTADKTSVPVRNSSGNILANQFVGTADKADRIKIDNSAVDSDSTYRTAKTTATANSIAARDSSGDIYGNIFQGTATAARYADLAEKYLCDKEYDIGTVVHIGGEKEVTSYEPGMIPIGVVSGSPALMMNCEQEGGTYIALKGRVPVKVVGPVRKGDALCGYKDGYAMVASKSYELNNIFVFAVAIEENLDREVKLVEAFVH